jgi:hypothetical protein
MALVDARYSSLDGGDLHLVTGMVSPRLDQRLFVTFTGNVKRRADDADLRARSTTVTFATVLASDPVDHGITFTPGTGEMAMDGAPRPGLRSFIVVATVADPTRTLKVKLRVHVHSAIEKIWLAPNPLTVRRTSSDMRLSVLARFGDGVVADVTNWGATKPPVDPDVNFARVGPTRQPWLRWSSPATGAQVSVEAETGRLKSTSDAGGGDITAEVGLIPVAPGLVATATVNCEVPWGTNVDLTPLNPVSTFASMAQRTNVLILPDGFDRTEKAKFEKLATGVVNLLSTNALTRPFDRIGEQVNYFTAWVPSPKPGVSVLNEVQHGAGGREGFEVPLAAPAPGGGQPWTIENLIDEVGLPAPKPRPDGDAGTPIGIAVANWQARFGLHITESRLRNGVKNDRPRNIYDDWLALTSRVLVDDVDSAFHMGFGSRPHLSGQQVTRSLTINPRRSTAGDFESFLNALCLPRAAPTDPVVTPKRWSFGAADQGNVVVICRSARAGGANAIRLDSADNPSQAHLIGLSYDVYSDHVLDTLPSGAIRLKPDALPRGEPSVAWVTAAHELAHSWTLLDEYKEELTVDAVRSSVAAAANVQVRDDLLVGPPAGPRTLGSGAIKWRWPRVAACGVLAVEPTRIDATHFVVKLRPHQALGVRPVAPAFSRDDIVRLRTRPLLESKVSDQAKVISVDPATDEVTVELLAAAGGERDLTTFTVPAGQESILLRLRIEAGRELLMVSQRVLDWIDAHHNPLNAAAGKPADRPWAQEPISKFDPTPARNFPKADLPRPPQLSAWIVGLYEEGAMAERDVYRPTGVCIMRQLFIDHQVTPTVNTNKGQAYQFCPVCRYVIVDAIDPAQHGSIDRDYEKRYVR